MSTTVQNIYDKVLGMIDQFSEDGVSIPEAELSDIRNKVILFCDMNQKELWKYNKNKEIIELNLKPPANVLAGNNTALVDFEGETQYYPSVNGVSNVQGYSIYVDGECTLTYQERVSGTWTDLKVVEVPGTLEGRTNYKGVLEVTDTSNKVRLKIDAVEHFTHMNRAFWKFKYKEAKVPAFAPWVKFELPADINTLDMVVEEEPYRQYSKMQAYKLEGKRDFYYDFYFEGQLRIIYSKVPSDITALTDVLEIDDILAQNIVYDIAAKIGFYENQNLVNWAEGRRAEGLQEAETDKPTSSMRAKLTYDWS